MAGVPEPGAGVGVRPPGPRRSADRRCRSPRSTPGLREGLLFGAGTRSGERLPPQPELRAAEGRVAVRAADRAWRRCSRSARTRGSAPRCGSSTARRSRPQPRARSRPRPIRARVVRPRRNRPSGTRDQRCRAAAPSARVSVANPIAAPERDELQGLRVVVGAVRREQHDRHECDVERLGHERRFAQEQHRVDRGQRGGDQDRPSAVATRRPSSPTSATVPAPRNATKMRCCLTVAAPRRAGSDEQEPGTAAGIRRLAGGRAATGCRTGGCSPGRARVARRGGGRRWRRRGAGPAARRRRRTRCARQPRRTRSPRVSRRSCGSRSQVGRSPRKSAKRSCSRSRRLVVSRPGARQQLGAAVLGEGGRERGRIRLRERLVREVAVAAPPHGSRRCRPGRRAQRQPWRSCRRRSPGSRRRPARTGAPTSFRGRAGRRGRPRTPLRRTRTRCATRARPSPGRR